MSEEMKELQTNEVTETMADYEDHFDDESMEQSPGLYG